LAEGQFLGKLEFAVLMAVARLRKKAYGVAIRRELLEYAELDVSVGALYATLYRLERKGLVSSRLGEPSPVRGGRAKKFFEIEAPGETALSQHMEAMSRMQASWKPQWGAS